MTANLKYAIRRLAHQPGFTAVVVLTLALGIGANTAIFSVVRAVLLRPLPYPSPERLVTVWETNPGEGWSERNIVSDGNYVDWRDRNSVFAELGAYGQTFGLGAESNARRRFAAILVVTFAGIAVTLALLGVYGVVSYTVAQRRPSWACARRWAPRSGASCWACSGKGFSWRPVASPPAWWAPSFSPV